MKNIEVKLLNPSAISDSEKMMVAMARMTQRGHKISDMASFMELLDRPYEIPLVESLSSLPHPTIQKFGVINVMIVGASRRFLAQITRHQNEVKFMSGSLQYSDYTGAAKFCVPYEITAYDAKIRSGEAPSMTDRYLCSCADSLNAYEELAKSVGNDAAGYAMPQGLRNVLLISATPFEWKHMISQRICRRNTLETMYVMLLCWEALIRHSSMFLDAGPSCLKTGICNEGKMTCKSALYNMPVVTYRGSHECSLPTALLNVNFPLIRTEYTNND